MTEQPETDAEVVIPEQPEIGPDYAEQLARFLAEEQQVDDPGPAEEVTD